MPNYILVVDDDEAGAMFTRRTLQLLVTEEPIQFVPDAEEAFIFLNRIDEEKPALIILDLKVSNSYGFEFLKKIRTTLLLENIPVIVASKALSESDRILFMNLGANNLVVKDFEFDIFFRNLLLALAPYLAYSENTDSYCIRKSTA